MTGTQPQLELEKGYFLPYQNKWILDMSNCKLWDKSRRIGATYAESYKAVRDRNKLDHKRDYWFSSADESAAYEFAEYCRTWCEITEAVHECIVEPYDDVIDGKVVKKNNYVVRFPHNGSRINCMSSNPRRFRSKGGDVCLDEFDWHDNMEEMYSAAEPCTMWGYSLSILTTRSYEGSLFDQLVKEAKKITAGDLDPEKDVVLPWSYHYVPITVAVEQGLAEKIKKIDHVDEAVRKQFLRECRARARSQDKFNREYMCMPSSEASTLIPYELYYKCQDEHCLETIGNGPKYMGFDVGREHHGTTFWIDELVGDVMVCREIVRMHKTPYGVQLQMAEDLIRKHNIIRACGDATGIGDMLVETLQKIFGEYRVEKIKFTATSKDQMASRQLGLMQDRRTRVPDDPKVRESFHSIKKVVTASNNVRYDTTQSGDEHSDDFWASCLAKQAGHNPNEKPEIIDLTGDDSDHDEDFD